MLLLNVIASLGDFDSYFPSHLNVFTSKSTMPSIFIPLEVNVFKSEWLKSFPIAPVTMTSFDKYDDDIAK